MQNSPRSDPAARPEVEAVPPEALDALRREWAGLWLRSPHATPFQSPDWLLPWSRHFAPGRMAAVSLRRDGRLAGLLPVFCWEGAMLLAGTGPSDHGGVLLEPGCEAALPALLAALPELRCAPWSRLDLQQLGPDSPLLRAPAPPGWTDERASGEPCFVAPLRGEDGLGAASKRRRSNWRYAVRRLAREGASLGLVPEPEIPDALEDLIRLHAARWAARGEDGVFADPLLRAFVPDAGCALAEAGILRLHQLRFGKDRAALLMVLAGPDTHHYYIGGFDPSFQKLSPSAALVGAAMAQAHEEGATAFDFLRGSEPYKLGWGARLRDTHRRLLVPPPDDCPATTLRPG